MNLNAWLTLASVAISPVIAVIITLWIEGRRKDRDGKMIVLRQLMVTRHLPADPMYSQAINLVPIEFNNSRSVMHEYKEYQRLLQQGAGGEPDVVSRTSPMLAVTQTKMIYAIMRSLKLTASEADLPVEAYASRGMIERDNLYLESLKAQQRIAEALERSVA